MTAVRWSWSARTTSTDATEEFVSPIPGSGWSWCRGSICRRCVSTQPRRLQERATGRADSRQRIPAAAANSTEAACSTGTVVTLEGEEVRGELRWDADEAGSWEILNGEAEGIEYDIEFGFVRRIVPGEEDGSTVTLADGRTLELDGPRDVSSDNKGVMVGAAERSRTSDDSRGWRLIPWDDIREVRFDPGPAAPGGSEGP